MHKKFRIFSSSLAISLLISAPVFAQAGSNSGSSGSHDTTTAATTTTTPPADHPAGVKSTNETESSTTTTDTTKDQTGAKTGETGDHHFTGDKLKLCEKHLTNINGTMGRLGERGQKQLDTFTTIATRVEAFYTKSGKTLDNYDALVAAVNAQKVVAQAAVDAVKADRANFKCDGTNPAGTAQTFKTDLQTEIQALKDYRTTIKNLITGVKSVVTPDAAKAEGGSH